MLENIQLLERDLAPRAEAAEPSPTERRGGEEPPPRIPL